MQRCKDIDIYNNYLQAAQFTVVAPLKIVTVRNFVSSSRVRTALRHKRRCFAALKKQ